MRRILICVGLLVWCAAAGAAELDITPLERNLRFNFGNPGARALGMGGAFLGRADDASAAEANPAGLTIISKRELTVEFRNSEQTSTLPGQFNLSSTNRFGFFSEGSEYSSSSSAPAFAAFAMPLGRVSVSAYYHRPLDFSSSQRLELASPSESSPGVVTGISRFPGAFSSTYEMTTFGFAAATKFGGFSIGAAARRQSLNASSTGISVGSVAQLPSSGSLEVTPTTLRNLSVLNGESSAMSFTGGFLWSSATESVTVGGVYKKGAKFDDITTNVTSCTGRFGVSITGGANPVPTVTQTGASTCAAPFQLASPFNVPDVYGLGMSIRFANGFTLNEDIVRVKYSQLLSDFHSSIFCSTFATAGYAAGASNPFCTQSASAFGFKIEDATEVHLGAEYLVPNTSLAFRAGVWVDPAHAVSFDPSDSAGRAAAQSVLASGTFTCQVTPCASPASVLNLARSNATTYFLNLGRRELHTSIGVGYVARSFEIHAGYDKSSNTKTASVQLLTRF